MLHGGCWQKPNVNALVQDSYQRARRRHAQGRSNRQQTTDSGITQQTLTTRNALLESRDQRLFYADNAPEQIEMTT